MPIGDGIRRNVATITADERTRLKNAIIELNRRKYPGNRSDTPVGGVSKWFSQDHIHQATHVHGGPAFLPWHRELVNRFEALLREVDPQLSLHYWDWTTDAHSLFTTDFMGSATGVAGEPWLSGGIYTPGANPDRDSSHNPVDPPLEISREVGTGAPITLAEDQAVINAATYPEMRLLLENSHDSSHGYIGGTLGDAHRSFRDPFVFLLHSNTDRLLTMWQTKLGHPERLDPAQVYGSDGSSTAINENLEPWAGDTGTRPWCPPDGQQQIKTSKHPSVVQPGKYDTATGTSRYAIKTANGFYVTAVGGGGKGEAANRWPFHTDTGRVGGWETFKLIVVDDSHFALQTFDGHYVTAVGGGGKGEAANQLPIHTDTNRLGGWERFQLIALGGNAYAIRTSGGNYLTAVGGGGVGDATNTQALRTDATAISSFEKFTFEPS